MLRAFDRDFQRNGPSTVRIVRTTLAGWKRHKNHPDPRVRDRYAWEAREIGHHVLGAWSPPRSSTIATIRRCTQRCRPCLQEIARRVRLEVAAGLGHRRPLGAAEDPQGRKTPGRRLQLRAADLLRAQRRGDRPARSAALPLRHAAGDSAQAGRCPAAHAEDASWWECTIRRTGSQMAGPSGDGTFQRERCGPGPGECQSGQPLERNPCTRHPSSTGCYELRRDEQGGRCEVIAVAAETLGQAADQRRPNCRHSNRSATFGHQATHLVFSRGSFSTSRNSPIGGKLQIGAVVRHPMANGHARWRQVGRCGPRRREREKRDPSNVCAAAEQRLPAY